jgi:hypothetical protein
MTDIVVDSIVSRRDFGTIFAGRLADGSAVRVKATNTAMLGTPSVGELWSVDGDLSDTRWGPQISASRAVRALPSGKLMVDYLAGCVAGIGPARARRLWQHFEDRLPEALDTGDVAALAEVMDPDRPVLGPRLAAAPGQREPLEMGLELFEDRRHHGSRLRHRRAAAEPAARSVLAVHCDHTRSPAGRHRRSAGDDP